MSKVITYPTTDEQEKATGVTVKELRQILWGVTNQEMTVRELRQALFQLDDQAQIKVCKSLFD